MKLASHIDSWNCAQQPVFLRADLNVPLYNNAIANDRRLRAVQPTLNALIKKKAIIILASHIGRPKKNEPHLSTHILIPWFEQQGYTITFCATIDEIKEKERHTSPGTILLLENLRFFPGEKAKDEAFIKQLRSLADWYVNDAFGTLHRDDASLALLAYSFPADRRSVGYLVEKELSILHSLMDNAKKPVCIIIGGGKVGDKIPLIAHLLDKVNYILLCPALVFTFETAQGNSVGKSLVDSSAHSETLSLLKKAEHLNVSLVFPTDYQVARGSLEGPLEIVSSDQFPDDAIGVSIGPKSLALFNSYIQKSGTIFYNGMMGFPEHPETLHGLKTLLTDISHAAGTSIIAGGDSIAVADQLSLDGIDYYSTGGGATLAYLSGKPLPALEPFY